MIETTGLNIFVRLFSFLLGVGSVIAGYFIVSRFRRPEKILGGILLIIIAVILILFSIELIQLP